jgi:Predicted transcriptional regulators
MNIGKNIQNLRKEAKMTQEELAAKLNVTHQAVSNWERSRTQPDIDTITKIAEVFNITIEEVIYGRKEKENTPMEKLNISSGSAAKAGVSFGSCLAMVISYVTWKSIPWAILHGVLGWVYVIYHAIKY